jgi:hypothetical protein
VSRSHNFPGLPRTLGRVLAAELLHGPCAAFFSAFLASGDRWIGQCPACRGGHGDPLHDDAIPSPAVAAALIRRGWPAREAHRHVRYEVTGKRYAHVPRGAGLPLSFRAHRRRAAVLTATGREDEIERFPYDRGYRWW